MKFLPLLLALACFAHAKQPELSLARLDGIEFKARELPQSHINIIDISSKEMANKTGLDLFPAFYAAFTILPMHPFRPTELRLDGQPFFTYQRLEEPRDGDSSLQDSGHHIQIFLKQGTIEVLFHKIEYPSNSGTYALRDISFIPHIFRVADAKEMSAFRQLFLAEKEIVALVIDCNEAALPLLHSMKKLAQQCPGTHFVMPTEAGERIYTTPGDSLPTLDRRIREMGISTLQELHTYNRLMSEKEAKAYGGDISSGREKMKQRYLDAREQLQP